MSSADCLFLKPLQLSNPVPVTRPSLKWVFDRTGTLVEVPADTLAVSYDPSDLSAAPFAVVDLEPAMNVVRNNTMQGASAGTPGITPTTWGIEGASTNGLIRTVVQVGVEDGIEFMEIRYAGIATANAVHQIGFDSTTSAVAATGQTWAASVFVASVGEPVGVVDPRMEVSERTEAGTQIGYGRVPINLVPSRLSQSRVELLHTIVQPDVARVSNKLVFAYRAGTAVDFTVRIGLPQLERDRVTSPIKTSGTAGTRAADVIGPGAGLVYSSVPITEPLWAAGTYAKAAKVRDANNFVFESLADGNTAPLTEKTKWLPLGLTNRLKMFDKSVNSQTTAPNYLTVVVKPGRLATLLAVLNIAGSKVTITQSESGYSRSRSLVTHNVLSWYDWFYQEPQWVGDAVFDVPPYINSLLTVHIESPGNEAALGGFFFGRPKFIGKTQWGLKAGILSYSGQDEDEFGNVTLLPRPSAKKMNFEVSIPQGYEDEVYRFMREADNIEMVAIASTDWSMTISYGYLGQWEVPLGIEGEKMPVEWRGLT